MTTQRRRGPARPKADRLREATGRLLLDQMLHGALVINPRTGEPVIGRDGKPLRRPPSAALVGQALRFISQERERQRRTPVGPSDIAKLAKAAADRARLKRPEGGDAD